MPSIRGTASVEDGRALNKALKSTKFPASFQKKLVVTKVNRAVVSQWIEQRITAVLGFEDEIVQSTAVNLFLPEALEDGPPVEVDPRKAQIDLAGFLGDAEAASFAAELWDMLLDAQSSSAGIPSAILEAKKKELALAKERQQERAQKEDQDNQQQQPPNAERTARPRHVPDPKNNHHHGHHRRHFDRPNKDYSDRKSGWEDRNDRSYRNHGGMPERQHRNINRFHDRPRSVSPPPREEIDRAAAAAAASNSQGPLYDEFGRNIRPPQQQRQPATHGGDNAYRRDDRRRYDDRPYRPHSRHGEEENGDEYRASRRRRHRRSPSDSRGRKRRGGSHSSNDSDENSSQSSRSREGHRRRRRRDHGRRSPSRSSSPRSPANRGDRS